MRLKPDKRFGVRFTALIIGLIVLLSGVHTYLSFTTVVEMYMRDFEDKALLTTAAVTAYVPAGDLQPYIEQLSGQPGFAGRQCAHSEAAARLRASDANTPGGGGAEALATVVGFLEDVSSLKDGRYDEIQRYLDTLLRESGVKYLYIFTVLNDGDTPTYLFDARAEMETDYGNHDDLGTLQFPNMIAIYKDIVATRQPFSFNYEDDFYGRLFCTYAPIRAENGDVVALAGADVGADALFDFVRAIAVRNAVITLLAALAAIAVISLYFSRAVVWPIRQLVTRMVELSAGVPSTDISPDILRRRDEFGLLTRAYVQAAQTRKDLTEYAGLLFEAIARGHLDARCEPQRFEGDYARMLNFFNLSLDAIGQYLDNLPMAVLIADAQMNPVYKNRRCTHLFGTMAGRHNVAHIIAALIFAAPANNADKLTRLAEEATRNGRYTVTRCVPPGGGRANYSFMVYRITHEGGPDHYLITAQEVTAPLPEKEGTPAQ